MDNEEQIFVFSHHSLYSARIKDFNKLEEDEQIHKTSQEYETALTSQLNKLEKKMKFKKFC